MTASRIQQMPSRAFALYQDKRLPKVAGFGPLVRLDRWMQARGIADVPRHTPAGDAVAFHPWRPGYVDLPAPADAYAKLGWTAPGPLELDGVVRRALLDFAALQNPDELARFLARVAALQPRRILEIGTSCGGLLFAVAQVAAPDATLVSIDLAERQDSPALAQAMPAVLAALVQPTQTLHAIRERSMLHAVRADASAALGGALDLLIVDADHSYGGVRSDVEMYGPLVRAGGVIALHDVAIRPENSGRGYEVGLYWDELAPHHATEVILDPDGVAGIVHQKDVAPLDRRPAALGWGLIRV
jgi:predicted O-methyltransferase YrrM